MTKTLKYSRYCPKYKIKTQTKTPQDIIAITLALKLQSFKEKLLSGKGFIGFESS